MDNFEDIKKLKTTYNEVISKNSKMAIANNIKEIFNKFPELESISWTQHTPYFNDGAPCVFGVNLISVSFNKNMRTILGGEIQKFKEVEEWNLSDVVNFKEGHEALQKLEEFMDFIPEVFQTAFGDGYTVKATRQGFEVEDYYD